MTGILFEQVHMAYSVMHLYLCYDWCGWSNSNLHLHLFRSKIQWYRQ